MKLLFYFFEIQTALSRFQIRAPISDAQRINFVPCQRAIYTCVCVYRLGGGGKNLLDRNLGMKRMLVCDGYVLGQTCQLRSDASTMKLLCQNLSRPLLSYHQLLLPIYLVSLCLYVKRRGECCWLFLFKDLFFSTFLSF